jgi:hypothetical protein
MLIASRVAARLSKNTQLHVQRKKGSLGELRVSVDGVDVVDSSVFAYPTPSSVIKRVESHLAGEGD